MPFYIRLNSIISSDTPGDRSINTAFRTHPTSLESDIFHPFHAWAASPNPQQQCFTPSMRFLIHDMGLFRAVWKRNYREYGVVRVSWENKLKCRSWSMVCSVRKPGWSMSGRLLRLEKREKEGSVNRRFSLGCVGLRIRLQWPTSLGDPTKRYHPPFSQIAGAVAEFIVSSLFFLSQNFIYSNAALAGDRLCNVTIGSKRTNLFIVTFISTDAHWTGNRWALVSSSGRWQFALITALQLATRGIASRAGNLLSPFRICKTKKAAPRKTARMVSSALLYKSKELAKNYGKQAESWHCPVQMSVFGGWGA